MAGFNVDRSLSENMAAAMAFWHTHRHERGLQYVLLLKLGSRDCRVTIAAIDNWIDSVEIIGARGSGNLGGNRYTQRLVNQVVEDLRAKHGVDFTNDRIAHAFLYNTCEQVKHTLSTENEAVITVKSSPVTSFTASITKYDFELLSFDIVARTIDLVQQLLDDCMMPKSSITDVVVFGGCANTVDFTEHLSYFFARNFPDQLLNPNDIIAYGAAVHSAILTEPSFQQRGGIFIRDVAPTHIGTYDDEGAVIIIERNTPLPARKSYVFGAFDEGNSEVEVPVGVWDVDGDFDELGMVTLELGEVVAEGSLREIRVTLSLDAEYHLVVEVCGKSSGKCSRLDFGEHRTKGIEERSEETPMALE